MSEDNKVEEASQPTAETGAPQQGAGDAEKTMDEYMAMHMERWKKRMQIIVALIALFILYMIYFMTHSN